MVARLGRRFLLISALAAVLSFESFEAKAEIHATEYEIKAAFLCNFAKFIEWPPTTFPGPNAPIVIGVLGEDPFDEALSQIVQSQTINGRMVIRKHSANIQELKICQILFISSSEAKSVRDVLNELKDSSVLTVSDMEGFTENGGMVRFLKKENKIRFAINYKAAKEAHLKISSQLLSLAESRKES